MVALLQVNSLNVCLSIQSYSRGQQHSWEVLSEVITEVSHLRIVASALLVTTPVASHINPSLALLPSAGLSIWS